MKQLTPKPLALMLTTLLASANSYAATMNVYNGPDLQQAIQAAQAGDEIVLQPGNYESVATGSLSGFANAHYYGSNNGTASKPIILRSANKNSPQELRGATVDKKIVLYITGDYWQVRDLNVTNGQKGIILDNANHVVIDNVGVYKTGQEAVHLRDNSSNNIVKNSRVYNTGLTSAGTGEAFYVGSHPGSDDGKGYVYGPACNNNVIGGNTIGPNVRAEHIDIKAGTSGTVFEYNTMDGTGISGANSADGFVDIKGENAVIRGNKAYRNGESNIKHAFETHDIADENTFIANEVDLDGSSNYLLFASVGVNHVSSNNKRLDGRNDRIASGWSASTIDNIIPNNIPAPGNYSSSPTPTPTPIPTPTPTPTACNGIQVLSWDTKSEVNLNNGNCVQFNQTLSGNNLQVWDSDTNSSCNFRGGINSVNGTGNLTVTSNYVATSGFTGTTLKIVPDASNCKYLKLRAY